MSNKAEVATIEKPRQQVAAVTPAQMLQIAVEQNADLDKLEKLMALQERWDAAQAKKAYVAAMSKFRHECPAIGKTRQGHNTKYAGLAEPIEQIKGILADCGLSHSWSTQQDGHQVKVTCTVTHIDGHSESTSLAAGPDTSGSKNSIQAIGSTVSYLQRYTLFAILGLASQEMDTDGQIADESVPEDELDCIRKAPTMDELQAVFRRLWADYPKAKAQLTSLKDARKKELSQ